MTLSRRWVFGLSTNNPILVDPLTAESIKIAISNDKEFKVRGLIGCFYDILEIFFGRIELMAQKLKCKNSE
jgi:hypothetical protein